MEIKKANGAKELFYIYRLYKRAFPLAERKPFLVMMRKCRKGLAEMLIIKNSDLCGLAITAIYNDYVLLDYFAISESKRGAGIGSEAIKLLCDMYKGKKFFLEIESTKVRSDNSEQRESRKRFYLKNGLTEMGTSVILFGIEMELLSNGCNITYDEYKELYRKTYGDAITKRIAPAKI